MPLLPNFKLGISSFREAHKMVVKHKLWFYVFFPAIINVALILLIGLTGWHYIRDFSGWISDLFGMNGIENGFLKFLAGGFKFFLQLIFFFLIFFIYSYIYRYLVLIIISPALALLSEKTDEIINNTKYPFSFRQLMKDIWRGIRIVLRNLFIELGFTILFFIIGFIPIIRWISPVALFFIGSYFYGFSMIDYTCERKRLTVRQSVKFIRKNRGMAISNGMIFYFVFFFIPVVGFIFAPAYALIAATIASHKAGVDSINQKGANLMSYGPTH